MKATKILQTLSAAVTIPATGAVGSSVQVKSPASVAGEIRGVAAREDAAGTKDRIESRAAVSLSHPEPDFSMRWAKPPEWDNRTVARYKRLAVKEALGTLDPREESELQHLEELRTRAENTLTAEQLLERYKREKTGQEMLRVLQRYVRVRPQQG